jgi:hypothetical protein
MDSNRRPAFAPRPLLAALIAAALAASAVSSTVGTSAAPARDRTVSSRALALHDAMRALWEAHGAWTERAIVDFVAGVPDTPRVIARLLENQADIGSAVKPFYGQRGGDELTALLKGHINAAVALLKAAKSGDTQAIATAKAAFYIDHILDMADMLSDGIIQQFPSRF